MVQVLLYVSPFYRSVVNADPKLVAEVRAFFSLPESAESQKALAHATTVLGVSAAAPLLNLNRTHRGRAGRLHVSKAKCVHSVSEAGSQDTACAFLSL